MCMYVCVFCKICNFMLWYFLYADIYCLTLDWFILLLLFMIGNSHDVFVPMSSQGHSIISSSTCAITWNTGLIGFRRNISHRGHLHQTIMGPWYVCTIYMCTELQLWSGGSRVFENEHLSPGRLCVRVYVFVCEWQPVNGSHILLVFCITVFRQSYHYHWWIGWREEITLPLHSVLLIYEIHPSYVRIERERCYYPISLRVLDITSIVIRFSFSLTNEMCSNSF